MSNLIIWAVLTPVICVMVGAIIVRRRPQTLKTEKFQEKWRDMQKLCATKETWRQAVIDADKLLDEALKKRRFNGKTMGERLTKAQRLIGDNEAVWFGHKLRNKLESEPDTKLKEKEIKDALIGIRQALKDLGALPDGK
jgi:predicted metal-dependent hydrolase